MVLWNGVVPLWIEQNGARERFRRSRIVQFDHYRVRGAQSLVINPCHRPIGAGGFQTAKMLSSLDLLTRHDEISSEFPPIIHPRGDTIDERPLRFATSHHEAACKRPSTAALSSDPIKGFSKTESIPMVSAILCSWRWLKTPRSEMPMILDHG